MAEVTFHRDLTQVTLRIAFIVLFTGASLYIFAPFLMATIWASMIVIATWPAMLRLQGAFGGRRSVAIVVMTAFLLAILVIPFSLSAVALVSRSDEVRQWVSELNTTGLPSVPPWVKTIPLVGPKIADTWNQVIAGGPSSLAARIAPYLGIVFQWLVAQVGGLGMLMLQFLLTIIISAVLFANGEVAASGLLKFGRRLAGPHGEKSFLLAASAVRGIAFGVVGTALLQTAAAALGLIVADVPGAPILIAIILVLCIAQLGPILILLPTAGWLFWTGNNVTASIFLVWTLLVGAMDNIIRPILIRKGVDLPLLLIMSGVMGGLIAFGMIGIFVGPVILAVTYKLLEEWVGGTLET